MQAQHAPGSEVFSVIYVYVRAHMYTMLLKRRVSVLRQYMAFTTRLGGATRNSLACSGNIWRRALVSILILYLKSDRHGL